MPGWNNSGWLADQLLIYPQKLKMKSYERDREEFLRDEHTKKVIAKQNEEQTSRVWEFKEESPKKTATQLAAQIAEHNEHTKERVLAVNQKRQQTNAHAQVEDDDASEDGYEKAHPNKKAFKHDLHPNNWKTKFLYPYALDPAPLRLDDSK